MKNRNRIASAGLVWTALVAVSIAAAQAQLTLKVVNQNPAYADTNIFLSFRSDGVPVGTVNGQPLQKGTNYSAADVNASCVISSFSGGAKIFVSLGNPLTSATASNGFAPNFNNANLADYSTRWDKVELSYLTTDPGSVANLTADDFASIPMKLSTADGSVDWHYHGSMQQVLSQLADLCGNSSGSVVTNGDGSILRVISPHTSSSSPWPSMQPYIDYVRTNGITTHIAGLYNGLNGGTGPQAQQRYDLVGWINPGGDLVITGSCDVAGPTTVVIPAAELQEAIYSANPAYVTNNHLPAIRNSNSVYDAILRDILAGFNLGLVGTTNLDPRTGTPFSNETTEVWYNYNNITGSSLHYTNVFKALWLDGKTFYNQYASILSTNTDAYGFPFNDTLAKPLLPLVNNPTLTITILPDSVTTADHRISNITVTNGLVTLTLTNLTPGRLSSIERTSNLQTSNSWQSVTSFMATTSTTNFTEAVQPTNSFFRARQDP